MGKLILVVLRLCWSSRIWASRRFLHLIIEQKESEVLSNEGFRVTEAARRQYHQSRRARFAPRWHTTPQSAHAVARREPPLADACRNPSPGTALRSFFYNAPGRAANRSEEDTSAL